jgi:hypothetical protein
VVDVWRREREGIEGTKGWVRERRWARQIITIVATPRRVVADVWWPTGLFVQRLENQWLYTVNKYLVNSSVSVTPYYVVVG